MMMYPHMHGIMHFLLQMTGYNTPLGIFIRANNGKKENADSKKQGDNKNEPKREWKTCRQTRPCLLRVWERISIAWQGSSASLQH